MATTQAAGSEARGVTRKLRGDFPTPHELVDRVVAGVMPAVAPGQVVRVLDPACGDGRFLLAAARRVAAAGGIAVLRGVDVDADAAEDARSALGSITTPHEVRFDVAVADALTMDWHDEHFDVVLGNPPYLSQLARSTTRGRASSRGGGPYADAAAEFLALAVERARPGGGRVGLVLPQSILASRDVQAVRDEVDRRAEMVWSWWSPRKLFDAEVVVCALGFARRGNSQQGDGDHDRVWSHVVTDALGIPALPPVTSDGTAGDRARFTANFRDEYYGLVPAVGDHESGPRLVTSGLIDHNRCTWGSRPVTFNKRRFARPRVDVGALDERMQAWAVRFSVPKVLIANQARTIECVVDADGSMLPSVPVITARPFRPDDLDAVAAVLSSPYASALVWHRVAGTGLSARTVRLTPGLLAAVPWPAGDMAAAVAAWRRGDVDQSGRAVHAAYGTALDGHLVDWWRAAASPSR